MRRPGRARRFLTTAAAVLALAAATAPARAASSGEGCTFAGVPRVVAVGDVHGAYDRFLAILQAAHVVDAKGHWSGGRTHLVQLGDVLDRGTEGPRVLDLLMRLQREAARAGGQVHALLGNHEVMNMMGDLRYVNRAEYAQFQTVDSEAQLRHLYRGSLARARELAKKRGESFDEQAFREKFDAQAPPGFVERVTAFSAEGRYGRWLRERPVTVLVNGVVFVHGGLTPESAALGCKGINAEVRRELGEDLAATEQSPKTALATSENGPLWFRGLARDDEAAYAPTLDATLRAMGAHAIVVGHTVTATHQIETRFGGRVILIDAGMTEEYGGHAAALEIAGDGQMTAVYPDGQVPLSVPLARPAALSGPPRPRRPPRAPTIVADLGARP